MSEDSSTQEKLMWGSHQQAFRDPSIVAGQCFRYEDVDPRLLTGTTKGPFWDILKQLDITLLVSREYEHLVLGLNGEGPNRVTFMRIPHPSGLASDLRKKRVYIASTRNPNQIFSLAPVASLQVHGDCPPRRWEEKPLVPLQSFFFPGCLYLHELSLIGGRLYANAVGENAVIQIEKSGSAERVWWPQCIETSTQPLFNRNYLQLNSIAAGKDIQSSFFTASTDRISSRRPGHRHFVADGAGVVFSGCTRQVVARGLTRPHSARLWGKKLWLDNSGYGEVGYIQDEQIEVVARLPGWTRGLACMGEFMFVGTSRIIERFKHYAPGLVPTRSSCGVHVLNRVSGRVLASITWPVGYQIFAIECVPASFTRGFPFRASRRAARRERELFYSFSTNQTNPRMGKNK